MNGFLSGQPINHYMLILVSFKNRNHSPTLNGPNGQIQTGNQKIMILLRYQLRYIRNKVVVEVRFERTMFHMWRFYRARASPICIPYHKVGAESGD